MFHPTVFDNLKISLENQLYDMDNLDEFISITNRQDIVDFAIMSRTWSLSYRLPYDVEKRMIGEVILTTTLTDLAAELLSAEEDEQHTGACSLLLKYRFQVKNPSDTCAEVERILQTIWQRNIRIKQVLHYEYDGSNVSKKPTYMNEVIIMLDRRITEEQMEDLPNFIQYAVDTLDALYHAML